MANLTLTFHTRVHGAIPALDGWADASGRAMRAANARLERCEDPRLVARTGYQDFGLGSKNFDHLLVDLRGRRDAATASAKLVLAGLNEAIDRAKRKVERREVALLKAKAAAEKINAAVVTLRAKLDEVEAKASTGSVSARRRAASRADAIRVRIASRQAEGDKARRKADKIRFSIHQGQRRLGVLRDRLPEAERRVAAPRLCFGSRDLFRRQHDLEANGYPDHAAWRVAWRDARSDDVYVVGDAGCPSGNGFVRATVRDDGGLDLEVRLPPCAAGHATRTVRQSGHVIPILDIRDVRFPHGGERVAAAVTDGGAVTWRFKRDGRSWRVFVSMTRPSQPVATTSLAGGCLAVDVNHGHWAVARLSPTGDSLHVARIPCVTYGRGADGTADAVRKAAKALAAIAAETGLPVVCERLDFTRRKRTLSDLSPRQARLLSSFAYSAMLGAIARACAHRGVHLREVNPAYTSLIARVSIAPRLGSSVHAGAAVAIGRRAMRFSERLPRRHEVDIDLGRLGRVALALPERMRRRHVWSSWNQVARRMRAAREALVRAGRKARSVDARATTAASASAGRGGLPPSRATGGPSPGRAKLRLCLARRAFSPSESSDSQITIR